MHHQPNEEAQRDGGAAWLTVDAIVAHEGRLHELHAVWIEHVRARWASMNENKGLLELIVRWGRKDIVEQAGIV